jgi:hypothetical protein
VLRPGRLSFLRDCLIIQRPTAFGLAAHLRYRTG